MTQETEGWVDCIYLDLKKNFLQGTSQETALETRKYKIEEGWFAEMDGRLFEQQRNENSNRRSEVRMVQRTPSNVMAMGEESLFIPVFTCSKTLILLSPLSLTYFSTLFSHSLSHPLALTASTINMYTLCHLTLWHSFYAARQSLWAVFDPLNHSTFHSFSFTRHTKFVIHTFISFTIHSSSTTGFN